VIAESYERIHRSNLIGMGVLPLQYLYGQNAESLGLTGEETFDIIGVTELNKGSTPRELTVRVDGKVFRAELRIDNPGRGGLLPQRRDHAVRAAQLACAADATSGRVGHFTVMNRIDPSWACTCPVVSSTAVSMSA